MDPLYEYLGKDTPLEIHGELTSRAVHLSGNDCSCAVRTSFG